MKMNSTANTSKRMTPKPSQSAANSRAHSAGKPRRQEVEVEGVYKNEKLVYHVATLIGCVVELQVKNGNCYEGILTTVSPELEFVICQAHTLDLNNKDHIPTRERVVDKLIVKFEDTVCVSALDADTKFGEVGSFTDVGISRNQNNGMREGELKELEPWAPEPDDATLDSSHLGPSGERGWAPEEMFRTNEKMGVSSSYNDNLEQYTTPLKAEDSEEYYRKRKEAEKLAEEIEKDGANRRNDLLENGDENGDEEMKYSAVHRQQHEDLPWRERASLENFSQSQGSTRYGNPQKKDSPGKSPSNGRDRHRTSPHPGKPKPEKNSEELAADLRRFHNKFHLNNSQDSQSGQKPRADAPHRSPNKEPITSKDSPAKGQGNRQPPQSPSTQDVKVNKQEAPVAPVTKAGEVKVAASACTANQPASLSTSTPVTSSKPLTTTVTSSTAEAAVVHNSKLNPEAKEFTLNPDAKEFRPRSTPASPGVNQNQPAAKTKTATVSVSEAQRKQEFLSPQSLTGHTIIHSNPAGGAVMQQPYAPQMMVSANRVLQRPNSYNGAPDGQPYPPNFLPATHPYPQFGAGVSAAGGPPGGGAMHPPTPPASYSSAHSQVPPGAIASQPNNIQLPHPPVPHSFQPGPGGHPHTAYIYQTPGSQTTVQQPPLQPSPHAPSASPGVNGPPGSAAGGQPPYYQHIGPATIYPVVSQQALMGYMQGIPPSTYVNPAGQFLYHQHVPQPYPPPGQFPPQ